MSAVMVFGALSAGIPAGSGVARAETAAQVVKKFDFGTAASPVMAGFTGVSESLLYTAERGYGLDRTVVSRNRSGGDDLLNDFVLNPDYTFMADVPNGEYDVTVYSGDLLAGTSTTKTNIALEGEAKGAITARQSVTQGKYRTTVRDGQLTLAISGAGAGGYLNGVVIESAAASAPAVPQALTVTGISYSDPASVSLQWGSVTDAVYYQLYRTPSGADAYGLVAGGVTDAVYTDRGVALGAAYDYRVTSVNASGLESAPSTSVTAEVRVSQQLPGVPSALSVTRVEPGAVSLQWTASSGAGGYRILRAEAPEGPFAEIGTSGTASYTDTAADTATVHYYRIAAYNAAGVSEASNTAASWIYQPAGPLPAGTTQKFDFGPGAVAPGYLQVNAWAAYTSELHYGFADPSKVGSGDRGTADPLQSDFVSPSGTTFRVDLPSGDYHVSVTAGDTLEATEVAIAAESIQKLPLTAKNAGEFLEQSFDIALVDGTLDLAFSGAKPKINALVITKLPDRTPGEVPTVYIAGDSTVQTYDEYWKPQAGWGQMLPRYFGSGVEFKNHAIGGRSSKSFIVEGRLDTVLRQLKPGDYLFVQFGHNDATISVPERYASVPDYKNYLKTYVNGARQRGAEPVFVTPVGRRDYNPETEKFNVSFPEYVAGMKEVAAELDVKLVDLSSLSRAYYDSIGAAATLSVFLHVEPGIYQAFPNGSQDNTHFQEYGAIQLARIISGSVKDLGLAISPLVQDVEPPAAVPAKPDGLAASSISNAGAVLKWNAVQGAEIYKIYRRPAAGTEETLVGTATVPTISLGGMAEGVQYALRVSAVNGRGESEKSDELLLRTKEALYKYDFGLPASPVESGYTQVTTMTLYTPETGYGLTSLAGMDGRDRAIGTNLQRDFLMRSGGYEFKVDVPNGLYSVKAFIGEMLPTGAARTVVSIEGKDYGTVSSGKGSVAEKVFNGVEVKDGQMNFYFGSSAAGVNSIANGVEITPVLQAPGGLQAESLQLDPSQPSVKLVWSAVEEAAEYRVYRKDAGAPSAKRLGVSAEPAYTDATADVGMSYEYTVTTVDSAGVESVASKALGVSMIDPSVPVPAKPDGLALGTVSKNDITLGWAAVEGAQTYNLYRSKKADGRFVLVGKTRDLTYTDHEVLTTIPYYYRVAAVSAGGVSEPSDTLASPAVTVLSRQMENIDRAFVAVKTGGGVYAGWRMLGQDPGTVAFNLYRDGVKLNASPITGSTNFLDASGTVESKYKLTVVADGVERAASGETAVWQKDYLSVPVQKPADDVTKDGLPYSYSAGDASAADLDGDGTYEIVMLWSPSNSKDNSQAGYTGIVYMDAYKLDGTRLWRINLGPNIRAGAHYTQFMAYDLDGDGKAEVAFKTADGTVDAAGQVIGRVDADHRNSSGYILQGAEYLTVFEGATGRALATTEYDPPRGDVGSWGDAYGNRVDRFLAAVAYLDGERPSLITSRGYYTRTVLSAYNYRDGQLTKVWRFDTNDEGKGAYAGQGNHNLTVGDVDADGKDEITFGAMAVDDDGTGLYSTGLGHGDAQHLGDLDPARPGLEQFDVHEHTDSPYGMEMRDAETGEILWGVWTGIDTGRGMSADIDPNYAGEEMWSATITNAQHIPISGLYNAKGEKISTAIPSSTNFGIWWDGDLMRELLDSNRIDKWDYNAQVTNNLYTAAGSSSNNGTKSTPALQADLFGDWREEVIWKAEDSSELRIYTTTAPTEHRIRTLMHDPNYRLAVAWQNVGYNQPPHPSFFLGQGMSEPAAPHMYVNAIKAKSVSVAAEGGKAEVREGGTLRMSALVLPLIATDASVTWSVTNPDGSSTALAAVGTDGTVQAKAAGTVRVTAAAKDGSGAAGFLDVVIVPNVKVTSVTVSGAGGATAVVAGRTLQMKAAVLPADAADPAVVWKVQSQFGGTTSIAAITADGLLQAKSTGIVKVFAVAADGSGVKGSAFITITKPVKVFQIKVSSAEGTNKVRIGSTLQMKAAVIPVYASDPSVSWKVVGLNGAATPFAVIDGNGKLTGKGAGTVKVVAAAKDGSGVTGSMIVTVAK
ncbi:rhamnogalacturonan lyase family protein [Paenibacillus caseinilyticus]|nr:Ig-like domain-containing protein [Paenibacillus caseinilyticus]MCZ8521221.1 Ig-like domain-containing protein [Paenibacillus caseinilyticus]